jgi:hypothetical protein
LNSHKIAYRNTLVKNLGDEMDEEQLALIDDVLLLLDIIVILAIEDNPVLGVVLVGLLKAVTKDRSVRIAFILLVIVLNMGRRK